MGNGSARALLASEKPMRSRPSPLAPPTRGGQRTCPWAAWKHVESTPVLAASERDIGAKATGRTEAKGRSAWLVDLVHPLRARSRDRRGRSRSRWRRPAAGARRGATGRGATGRGVAHQALIEHVCLHLNVERPAFQSTREVCHLPLKVGLLTWAPASGSDVGEDERQAVSSRRRLAEETGMSSPAPAIPAGAPRGQHSGNSQQRLLKRSSGRP